VVGALDTNFNIATLRSIGEIGRFLLPTDGLWHAAIYYLQPPAVITQQLAEGGHGDPFFAQGAPSFGYLLWVACWFAIVLGAGVISFERRELYPNGKASTRSTQRRTDQRGGVLIDRGPAVARLLLLARGNSPGSD
jgi:hypothetical protein